MCRTGKFQLLWRLVLVLVALIFGGQAVAQAQAGEHTQPGGRGEKSGAYRSQKNVTQRNKMTTAQRRAAAKRNENRKRAAGVKNQAIQRQQNEVKR